MAVLNALLKLTSSVTLLTITDSNNGDLPIYDKTKKSPVDKSSYSQHEEISFEAQSVSTPEEGIILITGTIGGVIKTERMCFGENAFRQWPSPQSFKELTQNSLGVPG